MSFEPDNLNILIVDDTSANLKTLTAILSERGYQVRPAINGEVALNAARKKQPDLILLDIRMPGIDGYEVCRRLKEDQHTRDIPVIFISALDETMDKVKAFELGGVDYITKPFQSEEVLARVKTHLQIAMMQTGMESLLQKLTHQQLFMEAVLENIEDGIVACDDKGTLTLFNRATREFHGMMEELLPPEEWGGHYDLYHSDRKTPMQKEDTPLYRAFQGEHLKDAMMVIAPKKGKKRTLLASGRLMKDSSGRKVGAIISMHDITESRKAEETLIAANERLQELDRMKSMFIASMSHELRTPLNSIIGFSGLLKQGISGDLNSEQQDSMERIYRAGNHLLGLISDVIDISKIEAGRIDVFCERFPLKDLVEESMETIRPQADIKGLKLALNADTWPKMNTDRKRLLQCLLNYLSNAVKFTESGKVTLSVSSNEELADIRVTDTGIGIAEEDMPKLFEAFERLETHLRVKTGGTGLGLYLTRKIAEEILHGSVSVESRLHQGSTFRLRIPINIIQEDNYDS